MLIILIGKSCSGKDTILSYLVKKFKYNKIVTYTTRPIRIKEIQDYTYHFVTDEYFKTKINDDFFIEYKSYQTTQGIWYYGMSKDSILNAEENSIVILTPSEYGDLIKTFPNLKHKSFYIYSNLQTIKDRLKKRGDDVKEAERRIEIDNKDFKGVEYVVDKIIYNNDSNSIDEVVNKIINYLEED